MKKLLLLVILLGGGIFAGIYFLAPKESDEGSLKKALSDNYTSFTVLADYMKANRDIVVIYTQEAKKLPKIGDELEELNNAGIICIWNKEGAVAFSTGKETQTSSEHYIIFSPEGRPSAYPDAADAGKTGWYIDC